MDCTHARLLLLFARPAERAETDLDSLKSHLDDCCDCRELVRRDRAMDEAVGRTMREVKTPTGLSSRILARLERERRGAPWAWLAVAAALLITVGLGLTWHFRPTQVVLDEQFFVSLNAGVSAEAVADWLKSEAVPVEVPSVIDLAYLDSYEMVTLQGRRVPRLLYVGAAHGTPAVAHVYIISRRDFRWNDEQLRQSLNVGSRSAELHPSAENGDYSFLIIYSVGSRDSFPRRGGSGI